MLTTDELRYILEDSGAAVVFTAEALWPRLEPLVPGSARAPQRVVVCEGAVEGTTALADAGEGLARATAGRPGSAGAGRDPLHLGHDGTAEGRYAQRRQHPVQCGVQAALYGYRRRESGDLFLPMFHVFAQNGILVTTLGAGGTVILHRRFDLDAVIESIARDGVTIFMAVPTIYITLLNAGIDAERLASVRYYFSAAATMPHEVAQRWHDLTGLPIYEGYGLTETSPFAAYNHSSEYRPGAVGTAIEQVEMRIVDADDAPLPSGTWGEICVRGPNIMLGYWNRPAETAEALRGGWFHTGDVGYMDPDGYVFIVDRTKDMINVAGFKIWPREVEEILYEHPADPGVRRDRGAGPNQGRGGGGYRRPQRGPVGDGRGA